MEHALEILERLIVVHVGALKYLEQPRRFDNINAVLLADGKARVLLTLDISTGISCVS